MYQKKGDKKMELEFRYENLFTLGQCRVINKRDFHGH